MQEPDWLTKARAEGRVKETAVRPESLVSSLTTRLGFMEEVLAGASEEEFQAHVIELAQANGWKVAHFRKVRVQRTDGSTYWETPVAADGKGFPDLCFADTRAEAGEQLIFFAELKVPPNKPDLAQREWIRLLDAYLWYPGDWKEIVAVLTREWQADSTAPGVPQELHRLADDGNPHAADD